MLFTRDAWLGGGREEPGHLALHLAPHVAGHSGRELRLASLGEVEWRRFFSVLTDTGHSGPVCIKVGDRAYERSLETRKATLIQSGCYLRQFTA
jgi:hypothetical protein